MNAVKQGREKRNLQTSDKWGALVDSLGTFRHRTKQERERDTYGAHVEFERHHWIRTYFVVFLLGPGFTCLCYHFWQIHIWKPIQDFEQKLSIVRTCTVNSCAVLLTLFGERKTWKNLSSFSFFFLPFFSTSWRWAESMFQVPFPLEIFERAER